MLIRAAFLVTALLSACSEAELKVPRGSYLELFYGAKSGGPANHGDLFRDLSKDEKLRGFAFFCVKGLSRAADSGAPAYAIDRERRLPPSIVKCPGSGAILMGPVQGEDLKALNDHLSRNYLHLYQDLRNVD